MLIETLLPYWQRCQRLAGMSSTQAKGSFLDLMIKPLAARETDPLQKKLHERLLARA